MDEKKQQSNQLTRNQKLALGFLGIFGVMIIILWIIQLKNTITSPFAYPGNPEDLKNVSSTPTAEEATLALKTKDTDKDGLSDYDELNIYLTSPFIADSDSDGISDAEEIKAGTNPNCPKGKNCAASVSYEQDKSAANPSTSTINTLIPPSTTPNLPSGISMPNLNAASASEEQLQLMVSGQMDVATLRKTLKDMGMEEKMLNQFNDEQLMKLYKNTYQNKTISQ